jgi:uncharacterized protein YqhQ
MHLNRIELGQILRRALRLVALPLFQGPDEFLVGGQAVIEGVMMRSPHSYAVAVRRPTGAIAVMQNFLDRPSEKHRWLRWPLLRGLGTLGQALVLGIRALRYSAEQAMEDPSKADAKEKNEEKKGKLSGWLLALNIAFSLGFFILFYKLAPLYLATLVKRHYAVGENLVVFNLVDGVIRIVLFLGFLIAIAQLRDMKRIFEYHGAEHKVVWAYEKFRRMDLEAARGSTRFHPRCGTSFLLVVMGIAMVVYLFLPFQSFLWKLVARVALLPVIAGVSYEFIRFAAKSKGWLWRWASQPGLWLQRVTTREPDDGQLETAIKALATTMESEKSRGGELVIA